MATRYPEQVEALKRLQKASKDATNYVDPGRSLPKYQLTAIEEYFDKFHVPGGQGNFGRNKYYREVAQRLMNGESVNWDALTVRILEENSGIVFTP